MRPHQERVVAEEKELREKLKKVDAFLGGYFVRTLSPTDRQLILDQSFHMQKYADILRKRISRFPMDAAPHQPE
jgi:hypothetical protein